MPGRTVRNVRPIAPCTWGDWSLRNGISYCLFDDCAIVLDRSADRYWRLGQQAACTLAWIDGDVHAAISSGDIETLQSIGLLEQSTARTRKPPLLPEPVRSLLEQNAECAPLPIVAALQICWAICATYLLLHVQGLDHRLTVVEQRRARPRKRRRGVNVEALACTFTRYRRIVPIKPVCLVDSLALLRFLHGYGEYPSLVLGVAAYPFAAHCWVQEGDTVINDALDHARLFKPILTV